MRGGPSGFFSPGPTVYGRRVAGLSEKAAMPFAKSAPGTCASALKTNAGKSTLVIPALGCHRRISHGQAFIVSQQCGENLNKVSFERQTVDCAIWGWALGINSKSDGMSRKVNRDCTALENGVVYIGCFTGYSINCFCFNLGTRTM